MDATRFDRIVKSLHSRRAALGIGAGIGALLGLGGADEAAGRRKKCGPCRRRKNGKCKPKPDGTRCGPCSTCDGGRCSALCDEFDCVDDGGNEICLKTCSPACNTCQACNRVLGACEPLCEEDQCVGGFCDVPCVPPCGACSACDFGRCVEFCPSAECVADRCRGCDPACDVDEECLAGECYPVCDPACEPDQACVNGACIDTARDCPAAPGPCFVEGNVSCFNGSGRCVETIDGDRYCAQGISCAPCESNTDCQDQGFGPNSRCVEDCEFCFGTGGMGCVTFAGG